MEAVNSAETARSIHH